VLSGPVPYPDTAPLPHVAAILDGGILNGLTVHPCLPELTTFARPFNELRQKQANRYQPATTD
jgi:hypothetical protein